MLVKNLPLTILKVNKREGVGKKSGKPYLFYNANVVDEDGNVFGFILSEDCVQEVGENNLLALRNRSVEATVQFTPKGFDVGGSIVDYDDVAD